MFKSLKRNYLKIDIKKTQNSVFLNIFASIIDR